MPVAQLLKIGALCSLLSAITTAILMYGPDAAPTPNFEAAQSLHQNTLHIYKKWVLFFHPQFAFIAALAIASILLKRSPALICIGVFYMAVWAITEMSQQAYLIDALNQIWRPAYLAPEAADKELWRTMIIGLRGITDSQYFILLFSFGTGSVLVGIAFLNQGLYGRIIGAVTISIGFMSLLAFGGYYTGFSSASVVTGLWYSWLYGPLQIGVRLLVGWWLIKQLNPAAESFTNKPL